MNSKINQELLNACIFALQELLDNGFYKEDDVCMILSKVIKKAQETK